MKYLFFLFLFVFNHLYSQVPRKQLEEQKASKQKNIEEINKILQEASTKKQRSLGELNAINALIYEREQKRIAIRQEISLIEKDISDTEKIIGSLEADLKALKKEYAKMIYQASKTSSSFNQINFIISSTSFNDLFRRVRFIKQYAEARKKQLEQIEKTKKYLENQSLIIKQQREEKANILASLQTEDQELLDLKSQQDIVVKDLSSREAELRQQYLAEKKALKELDDQVLALIRAEMKRSSGDEAKNIVLTNPDDIKLASSFAKNKGKLPWPVDNGFIAMGFGKQKHPSIANLYLENPGIKIQAKQGSKIKAVFAGKVEAIRERMGPGYSIMINHGDFFTYYEPIENLNVKENERIKVNQVLGTIVPNLEGTPEVLFSIYKNDQKLDPTKWLYNK
jgi:septal ring factor EnvC (AmiA/AmiB activator)